MALLNNNTLAGASGQAGGYFLEDSLRFRSSASANLTRTYGTPTSARIFTLSMWVKRGKLGSLQQLYSGFTDSTNRGFIAFQSGDFISCYVRNSGGDLYEFSTPALFRDTSAWYHIVVAFDTTQATATNRVKVYVNGVQHTLTLTTTTQNVDLSLNTSGSGKAIGQSNSIEHFDGYMTEINFVDGQQLAPSDFGESNEDTGVWQPKEYSGSYGTNGFYLKGRGTDNSGNGNNWTENNIDTSSGDATYDLMSDVPTLTDEDTNNFATLNPNNMAVNTTMTDGNLKASNSVNHATMFPTIMPTTGKYYFECKMAVNAVLGLGFRTDTNKVESAYSDEANKYYFYLNNSNAYRIVETTNTALGSNLNSTSSTFQVAIDFDAAKYYFGVNNTWYAADWGTDGDPASGTNPSYDLTDGTKMFPFVYVAGGTWTVNFGQQPFNYTPPTGYKKLNTFNLPDSTITDGSEHFGVGLWTGTGSVTAPNIPSVTNIKFKPEFLWSKSRSTVANNYLYDIVRSSGDSPNKFLGSNTGDAEQTFNAFTLTDTGFNLATTNVYFNQTSATYVAWNWKAGGTAVSNTDGTITSTVSANTTAGFSVVTYTGTGSNATVGHGLGIAPKAVIVKARTNTYTSGFPTQIDGIYGLRLSGTGANDTANGGVFFNNTAPTTSVFTVGTSDETNESGWDFVAYAFAEVEGYSKISSYTGNGSADGPFIYTGFRPAFIMFRSTSLCNWVIVDSARSTFNVMDDSLYPNTNGSEITTITDVDFLSNGFKWRANLPNETNASGQTYVYMAFAENPFKNSNAR